MSGRSVAINRQKREIDLLFALRLMNLADRVRTVVMKMHADTILEMLLANAEASTLPASAKSAPRCEDGGLHVDRIAPAYSTLQRKVEVYPRQSRREETWNSRTG